MCKCNVEGKNSSNVEWKNRARARILEILLEVKKKKKKNNKYKHMPSKSIAYMHICTVCVRHAKYAH